MPEKETITYRILKEHMVSGRLAPGEKIGIIIDQTMTQDATGTMAYLQFEALGIPKVKTKLSLSYIDHNTLQTGFENADDHRYLQTAASKYGVYLSQAGNGICHQVHLERFGVPGETLLGSDSHTPTAGGLGMMGIGAGGLDVALAMAGKPFYLTTPKVIGVQLEGSLAPWVSAKDIILEVLRQLTVKGGVGKTVEYFGSGVKSLSIPERATITNMGAELGATTSIFPSDSVTREFLEAQGRGGDWRKLDPGNRASYDEAITLDLANLKPLVSAPHSPDNIKTIEEVEGLRVQQVCIGSCTNSSYLDLMTAARILAGKKVDPGVSLTVSPGSRQVLTMLSRNGAIADMIDAGARVLEATCGPCIGMGQAPPSAGVSLRTFNRNFMGRSGTKDADIYLLSPAVAAASALAGHICDPRKLGEPPRIEMPDRFLVNDNMIIPSSDEPEKVEIVRGPNIKPLPMGRPLPDEITGQILIKVGDDITTDHIMPAGAKILPLRSNIPAISNYVFSTVDPTFPERAREAGSGFVVSGRNYGQGSSREHAALAPMSLGVRAVIAKSFARIHMANLINFGIIPLVFENEEDYDKIDQGDNCKLNLSNLETGAILINDKKTILLRHSMDERDLAIVRAGGSLPYARLSGAE